MKYTKPDGKRRTSIVCLREGFKRFYDENGRYPNSVEIDDCKYLCSSRQIERKYGGLRKLRELLGLEILSYSDGKYRVEIGKQANKLSIESEESLRNFLVSNYGELFVHEESKIRNSKQRVDFFVYAIPNFVVDVFNTYTLHNLATNINVKIPKYKSYPDPIYFVVTGAKFSQEDINLLMLNKQNKLNINMKCLNFVEFKNECLKDIRPIKTTMKYCSRFQLQTGWHVE